MKINYRDNAFAVIFGTCALVLIYASSVFMLVRNHM